MGSSLTDGAGRTGDNEQALRARLFEVMSAFPTGVAVVTTTDSGGRPVGLTTTALCSVSAAPPLLLVCVGNGSRTRAHLTRRGSFVVHIMAAEEGRETCVRFASKAQDKFAGLDWRGTASGLPLLTRGVLAWAECAVVQEIPTGDHTTVLARYVTGEGAAPGSRPLLYHRRGYWDPAPAGG